MPLNPSQKQAIEEEGAQLILAGPGSGKTRVVTQKIVHLVNSGIKPENILALTFSDKAATEMADRLEQEIDISDLTIGTFHSFCLELLKDNVLDSGISFTSGIISGTNQLVWGLRNLDSFAFEHIEVGNNEISVIDSILEGISAFRDELITPEDLERYLNKKEGEQLIVGERAYLGKLKDLLTVYKAYLAYKRKELLLDFDDMIHETSRLLERKPELLQRYRERFTHILVDEFQDTNYAQLNLIKQLSTGDVSVVGDDDQSIYRFRGAYLTNFVDFKDHFGTFTETLLDVNYRNSGNILSCALQLMRNAPNREEKPLITHNRDGAQVVVARCENEQAEAQYACATVERLVGTPFYSRAEDRERPLTYGDIALLSRRRAEGAKYHAALRERGVPCEFVGEVDFFATPVIRDALAYLNVIENPLEAGIYLNRIMKLCGITEVNVQRLNGEARQRAWDDDTSDCVYECMCDGRLLLETQRDELSEITRCIDHILAYKERTSISELIYDVTVRHTDLYKRSLREKNWRNTQLLNKLHEIANEYESITKEPTLSDFLDYLNLLTGFQIELEEVEETNSVKVMTVHQSKGKEFPVVFIVDAATSRFPLRFQAKPFYVPNDLARGIKTGDDERSLYEQEERRLFYVAMTRAEQRLYVTFAERYGQNVKKTKPSKFLEELEFEQNPRIEIVEVAQEAPDYTTKVESPVEQARATLQDHAIRAIDTMQLKTAVQKIVELEKLRLLESGQELQEFDLPAFLNVEEDDAGLTALFEGKREPLVSQDHHFSASGLQTYSNCPAQYKFSNVLRVPSPPRTYFQLGSVVHEVIERLTTQEREGTPPTKDRAYEMLEHFWSSAAYTSKQKEAEDKTQAQQMLDTYLAWNERNDNEIIGAEMKFTFTLNGRSVTGFIDRVEKTPLGEYIVLDYKTGYPTESRNSIKQNIQMNVYTLAVLDKFDALPQRASLYYVKHDKMVDYLPTQDHVEQQQARLSEMIDNVVLERFPGMPTFQTCRSCSYKDLCEEKEIRGE
jgi:DNA helicase-2/ATP-dependent DNA helicase PcrA